MIYWNTQFITLTEENVPFGYITLMHDKCYNAIGGLRILDGHMTHKILPLCLALAVTMSKKANACGLPISGAKAVICLDSSSSRKRRLRLLQRLPSHDVKNQQDYMNRR